MSSLCLEHGYNVLSDSDHLDDHSGSFHVVSEAQGTTSWIDHCMCATQAHASLVDVNMCYVVPSSSFYMTLY